jgi:CheY-like chemotaxis protein
VEAEPLTRRAIARLLEQSGAQVTSCQSVPAALAALEKEPPDILLSDLSMPGEDGLALIRKIRWREAEAAREQKSWPESRKPKRRQKGSDHFRNGASGPRATNARHARVAHLPAAALTARAMPHDRDAALQAGFEAYIAKPVDAAQLVDLVRGLVQGRG